MGTSEDLINTRSRQWTHYHHSNISPGRKSNLRLNDQIIPKPTDINMGEKIIKVATPKEHPYASHIARYSLFPSQSSSRGSEDEKMQNFVPNSAPEVTLLSKTKGNAYRHEILKPPTRAKKAVTWAEEQVGFLEFPKPFKGDSQVFYPTPTKLMHPKPVRDELPLSDERKEMWRRVEQTHWLTSYQLHYSGYEKGHLKMDSQLRSSRLTRRNAHSAPQRVKPVSPPVPPTLIDNHSRTNDLRGGMTGPSAHRPVTFPAPLQRSFSAVALPGESSADRNESARPHRWGHGQSEHSSGMGHTLEDALSHGAALERTVGFENSGDVQQDTGRPLQHGKLALNASKDERSDRSGVYEWLLPGSNQDTGRSLQHRKCTSMNDVVHRQSSGKETKAWPRPPALPGIRPRSGEGLSLKELQDSYSKTQAHRRFNSSTRRAHVDLKDNVCAGKRHDFYGVNVRYLHG